MKKLLSLFLSAILVFLFSGCNLNETLEELNVSEIVEVVESQITIPETKPLFSEVPYDEPFVYNTYYDAGYTALNVKQRELYESLYLIALQMPEGYVKLCEDYDNYYSDTGIAYNAMLNDHPDFFWMPYTYVIGEIVDNNGNNICIAFEINEEENQNEYLVDKQKRNIMLEQLNRKINEIILKANEYKSFYDKAKFFNDYLCDNTVYDENAELSHTTYGCLINGKALCEGYSRAFKLLCNQVGIKCDLIYGRSENEDHMWNCLELGGKYCYTDVTWNDGDGDFRYVYLNMTEKQLLADRTIYPHFTEVNANSHGNGQIVNFVKHTCDYDGNSYYAKNGLMLNRSTISKIAKKIDKEFLEGSYKIQLLVNDENIIKSINSGDISVLEELQRETKSATIYEYAVVRDILTLFFKSSD